MCIIIFYNFFPLVASEAVKALIDVQTQKGLAAERPILHNTYMVDRSVMNLKQLMMDLPTYADRFLNMICNILQEYKETCQATYRGECQLYQTSMEFFHVFILNPFFAFGWLRRHGPTQTWEVLRHVSNANTEQELRSCKCHYQNASESDYVIKHVRIHKLDLKALNWIENTSLTLTVEGFLFVCLFFTPSMV